MCVKEFSGRGTVDVRGVEGDVSGNTVVEVL